MHAITFDGGRPMPATQANAVSYIASHGHLVETDGDRIIAGVGVVFPDGRVVIEFETFLPLARAVASDIPAYSMRAIRDWLGY